MARAKRFKGILVAKIAVGIAFFLSTFGITVPNWVENAYADECTELSAKINQKIDLLIKELEPETKFDSEFYNNLKELDKNIEQMIQMPQQARKLMPQQARKMMPTPEGSPEGN